MTKRTKEEIDQWLENIYLNFIKQCIPHTQREWLVRSKIDEFLKVWSIKPIPEKEYALQWIRDRCKKNSNHLPVSIFAYYYDTEFWEIKIPNIYGEYIPNPLQSLTNMPPKLIQYLCNNSYSVEQYTLYWANCFDLTYGSKEIPKQILNDNLFAANLLFSGIQNLNAATITLLYTSNNTQTIMTIRMALEMFIKSYIAFNDSSAETYEQKDKQARKISHDLKEGLKIIQSISPSLIHTQHFQILKLFPNINDRYIPQNIDFQNLASCYTLTVHIGACVTRSITDRNILNQ